MRKVILILVMAAIFVPLVSIHAQNVEYVGSISGPGVNDIKVAGNYAYCAITDGLAIFDISTPSSPNLISQLLFLGYGMSIYLSGSYAYLGDEDGGLQIIDISNPAAPYLAARYMPSDSWGVYLDGIYAFIADGSSGLQIVNIPNPSAPIRVGNYNTPGIAFGVYVLGNYAYVADDASGLLIINISNPASPTLAGWYHMLGPVQSVYVSGEYAYVAALFNGLQIINVSNPSAPTWTATYDAQADVCGTYVSGIYAYVAATWSGLQIINISNPADPRLIGGYDTPQYAQNVFLSSDYIYIADLTSFIILRFTPTEIDENNTLPKKFALSQNYPNPFNPTTQINYSMPKDDDINISIYNLLGQKVAILFDGKQKAGEHSISWDGKDFPSGIYFARLASGEKAENIKMVLLK